MRSIILRRFLCTFVITAGCATGEMHRVGGDGADGPGDGSAADESSSSDPSGTPVTAESGDDDPSSPGDATDSDPSVGDSSDTAPTDTDPTDTDPTDTDPTDTDPTDTDPTDTDPTGESSGGNDESTGDPTDTATDATDTDSDTAMAEPVDLSGYTIVQTDSDRQYVIPDGTIVPRGGYLVIARNASPGAFQDFWGVNWGDDVIYIDTDDAFPTINGAETFSLLATDDQAVDGPTPLLELATGAARLDAAMLASDPAAWSVTLTPNDSASPGADGPDGGAAGLPFISEYVDPTGAGNFVYEFVEIRVAP